MSASTAILTDLLAVVNATPTSQSTADSIAPAGPIEDLIGNINVAYLKARELKYLLTKIQAGADSGDANYFTKVGNVLLTLV